MEKIGNDKQLRKYSKQCTNCECYGDPRRDFYNSVDNRRNRNKTVRSECKLCCRRKQKIRRAS